VIKQSQQEIFECDNDSDAEEVIKMSKSVDNVTAPDEVSDTKTHLVHLEKQRDNLLFTKEQLTEHIQ
jgi:hypothetical protein